MGFASVKYTYRTFSGGLRDYGECLFFPGIGQSDKSDNLEGRTAHEVWDVSLRAESRLYASHYHDLNLSCLEYLGADYIENIVPLLQGNCCVRVCWRSSGCCMVAYFAAVA
jgi:hypothetical protein